MMCLRRKCHLSHHDNTWYIIISVLIFRYYSQDKDRVLIVCIDVTSAADSQNMFAQQFPNSIRIGATSLHFSGSLSYARR